MVRNALLPLLSFPGLLAAQGFVNSYGGNLAQDGVGVAITPNGFCVGVRSFGIEPSRHFGQTLMTSAGGSIQEWNTLSDPPGKLFLQVLTGNNDGDLFLAGSIVAPDGYAHDGFIEKRTGDNSVQWTTVPAVAGNEQYFALAPLADGGVVACGIRENGGGHDAWVSRFSASGTLLWSTAVDGGYEEEAYGVAVSGNDILITGRQLNFGGTSDALFARLDGNGNLVWTTAWGGVANDIGRAIVPLDNGNFLMAGTTNSFGTFDITEGRIKDHVYLVAIDLNGDSLWTRAVGDTINDHRGYGLHRADNNDLFVSGERGDVPGETDALVQRLDASGNLLWARAWHTGKEDRLVQVHALTDGFIACGWAFTEASRQVLLVRRNADGN
jgi:hypothetical protein